MSSRQHPPERLLSQCMEKARVYAALLSDAEKHELFFLSAAQRPHPRLQQPPYRLAPFVFESLRAWHAGLDAADWMEARLQLLARHAECSAFRPPGSRAAGTRVPEAISRMRDPRHSPPIQER